MYSNEVYLTRELKTEDELFTLLSPTSEASIAVELIRKINKEIFETYENNVRKSEELRWYVRNKEVIFGTVCGLIAVSVMAIWASQTLPTRLKTVLEPSLHEGHHGLIGGNDTEVKQSVNFDLNHSSISLRDDSSDVNIPESLIIFPIVKFTASAHVVGQVLTWVAEWIGIKKPALSLREYRLLSKAVDTLVRQQKAIYTDPEEGESHAEGVTTLFNESITTGKTILCHQKKTYLQASVYFTVFLIEAILIYYISMLAMKSINGISESFLNKLFNENGDPSTRSGLGGYGVTDHTGKGFTVEHSIKNMTFDPMHHFEEEMYPPLQQTLAVGVFTSVTAPAITLISKIPAAIKGIYERIRNNTEHEMVEFDHLSSVPVVVEIDIP